MATKRPPHWVSKPLYGCALTIEEEEEEQSAFFFLMTQIIPPSGKWGGGGGFGRLKKICTVNELLFFY